MSPSISWISGEAARDIDSFKAGHKIWVTMTRVHREAQPACGQPEPGSPGPLAEAFSQFALILGGAVVIAVSLLTLHNLTDHTVFTLTVPGFLLGLALVVPYIMIGRPESGKRPAASLPDTRRTRS
jgi:hypothetical protein